MYSIQRASSMAPGPSGGRPTARRPAANGSSSSTSGSLAARLARKVFQQKYSLQLAPGVIDWLDAFVNGFELDDEDEIVDTFEHLVRGAVGSGSGLGASLFSFSGSHRG